MFRSFGKKNRKNQGFTLMEVMVVVGIIAVIAAIAIPSVISMQKNMDHRQRNDYAKTIFLAAQSNLAEMRSTGELDELKSNTSQALLQNGDDAADSEIKTNFPNDDFSSRYVYTYHDPGQAAVLGTPAAEYDKVLPVNSVEAVIRDKQVIIEYNPRTGSVYSVFYSEDYSGMAGKYQSHALQRNEEWCKENQIGYYNGSDLGNTDLPFVEVDSQMSYVNGQEGLLNIEIGLQGLKQDGSSENLFDQIGVDTYVKGLEMDLTVIGETGGMFTTTIKKADESVTFDRTIDGKFIVISVPFDSLIAENSFTKIKENENGQGFHVQPGDNVSLTLEVKFVSDREDAPVVVFDDCVLAGINPLFHSLTGDAQTGYTLAISNGRHLQNLNAVAADIAQNVKTITFVNEEKKAEDTNKTEEDASNGQGTGSNTKTTNGSTNAAETLEINWKDTTSYYMENHPGSNVTYFAPISNAGLFDANQRTTALTIDGNNVVIRNLRIKDSQTSIDNYVNPYGAANADVGLFRYVSGTVQNLRIVNPVIQGGDNSFAVGTLAGSVDQHTTVNGCYVYVDTSAKDFNWNNLDISTSFDGSSELKYGVSGSTAVGGMVGVSEGAVFTSSFAAVPVYGDMGSKTGSNVGVGGFVGAANGGSFNKCYTSVRTLGKGAIYSNSGSYCGLGGFVGTSDHAKFTNCFASGNVTCLYSNGLSGSGGFVGVAVNNSGSGWFDSCYSLGTVHYGTTLQAKFVGADVSSHIANDPEDRYKQLLHSGTYYIYEGCYYLQGFGNTENADNHTLSAAGNLLETAYSIEYKDPYIDYILNAIHATGSSVSNIESLEDEIDRSGYRINGVWESCSNARTNTYIQGNNARYPYAMLTEMPFYGTWQEAPSEVRMAYWELYDGENGYGIHYDDDSTTHRNETVIADGYMLLSARGGSTYTVQINGQSVDVKFSETIAVDGKTYYYGFLPDNVMASDSFYTEVKMKDGNSTYTMYFNPNVAMSQVNPKGNGTTADYPGDEPVRTVVIRSPRQLAALDSTSMAKFMNNEFVLLGNIDFTKYNVDSLSLPSVSNFSGKLTGVDAVITVSSMETGLIDTLSGGTVSGITLNATNIALDGAEGALVNTMNSGTLSGCTVEARITGTGNAGLMVGALNGGTISNCGFEGTNSNSLGFVGTAKKLDGSKAIEGDPNYVGSAEVPDGRYILSEITGKGLSEIETGEMLFKQEYAATITSDCEINGTPVVTGKYYYSVTGENTYEVAQENAIAVENIGKTALSGFGTKASEWTKHPYYVQVDGNLHPLYVKVEVEEVEITAPAVVSELDGTDQEENPGSDNTGSGDGDGGTDASQPSETPTEPTPQYETVYTYSFSLDNGETQWMEPVETKAPSTETNFVLYSVHIPTSGNYVLFNGRNNILSAVPVTNFDGTITANMIWTASDGMWVNKQDNTVTVKPELVIPINAALPVVNINGTQYAVFKVTEVESRDVKLVDSDLIYSTTKKDAEPAVPADATEAPGSGEGSGT